MRAGPGLVSAFLGWMDQAGPRERAEAVRLFAETVFEGAAGAEDPRAVDAALTLVLDDPAPSVRRALALVLASRADAPRHLVLGLAGDEPEVSAVLVARSPLLTEADLIELAAHAGPLACIAIALRAAVPSAVSAALVARGDFEPCLALVGNHGAEIAEADLLAIAARFGDRPRLRTILAARPELPPAVRHRLMLGLADALGRFATSGGFLSPARSARGLDEELLAGTLAIARRAGRELPGFVAYLRDNGFLTPMLLFRAVLAGDLALLGLALADLTGLGAARVAGMLRGRSEAALAALMTRAGLPGYLVPVLVAATRAAAAQPRQEGDRAEFLLPVIRAAEAACLAAPSEETTRLIALLRRFGAEAARAEARRLGEALRREATRTLPSLLPPEIGPAMLALAGSDAAEAPPADRRILRARGLVLDEPIPDLATIIADWKVERDPSRVPAVPARNANEKPGRSRAA
ncbi:MAG: DUF2336 domain-containing protein [Rhabdaerophilum calidifontis]